MTVRVDAGMVVNGVTLTEQAAQTSATITAPSTNPRIDRIVIDAATGTVSVVTGTQAASPTAPAIPSGKLPGCRVRLQTSSTIIGNSMITDERALFSGAPGGIFPGDLTVGGNLTVSGVGPHAIGVAIDTRFQYLFAGIYAPTGGDGFGLGITNTLSPGGGASGVTQYIGGVLNKAGSGTHTNFASLMLIPPVINAGAATLTNATTLHITGAPSVGTNQRALWVVDGMAEFGGLINLSGGQLKFPATQAASGDANTLDDYEKGTWTPSVGGSATYTTQTGVYTKIGGYAFLQFDLTINSIGTGSTTTVSGLPFTPANNATFAMNLLSGSATNLVFLAGQINAGSTSFAMSSMTAAAPGTGIGTAVFANSTGLRMSGGFNV